MGENTITVKIDDAEVTAALKKLAERGHDMSRPLAAIGEALSETTKKRFDTSTAPDGSRWAANSQVTYDMMIKSGESKGKDDKVTNKYLNKNGRLNAKGRDAAMGKKPLVATGILQDTIRYQNTSTSVTIGTNRFANQIPNIGAAVHQLGSDRAGRGGKVKIPARPFLGLSDDDKKLVLDIIADYLMK